MTTTPTLWKSHTQVNTSDAPVPNSGGSPDQSFPQIVALDDGGYVVAWTDRSRTHNPGGTAVVAQKYDVLGEKVGGEVKISQFNSGDQSASAAVALPDGGFLIAYNDVVPGSADIYVRRYDASFNFLRTDVIDNTTSQASNAALTPFADGSYVVSYRVKTARRTATSSAGSSVPRGSSAPTFDIRTSDGRP